MKLKGSTAVLAVVLTTSLASHAACAQSKRKEQQKKEEQPVVVLGTELEKAAEAEARRKASGDTGVSPMPAFEREDNPKEFGLVRPKPDAYDAALAELCKRYAKSDAPTRATMRRAIDMEDLGALLNFGMREAVFGIRERSVERVVDGLTAVAMVEKERQDFRDVLMTLSLLHYCALRIGANPDKLFRDAAALAEPGTAEFILHAIERPPTQKTLHEAWGFEEVETEAGAGFIQWNLGKYEPTYDLKKLVIETADLFAADRYEYVHPTIASDFSTQRYWLGPDDKAALERVMLSGRAGASVDATFGEKPNTMWALQEHSISADFAEMSSESAALELLDIMNRKKPPDYSVLALREGRLVCFVMAGSSQVDVKSVETDKSIKRFIAPLSEIMRRHTGGAR